MLKDNEAPGHAQEPEEPIEIEFVDEDQESNLESATDEDETEEQLVDEVLPADEDVGRLRAEVERMREMYLRKLAEFDNFRKRTEREREELKQTAAEALIRELLPVIDNFERALQHAGDENPESFRQGVEMIARQLSEMLEREGLEAVDPEGQQFEPELHEAVHRVEGSGYQPGTVVSVLVKGYTLGGRLIRPAMVGVAVDSAQATETATPDPDSKGQGGESS